MNQPTHADDELLSSYLDGEATPDEVARIEADPVLMGRVADLHAARDLIATPVVPLSPDEVDRLIGRALDASQTSPVVTAMGTARARRSDRTRTIAAVAAAVALIALAVPLITYAIDLDGGGSETVAVDAGTAADDTTSDDTTTDDTTDNDERRRLDASAAEPLESAADDTGADDAAETVDPMLDGDQGLAGSTTVPAGGLFLFEIEAVTNNVELGEAVRERFDEFAADVEAPYARRAEGVTDLSLERCADVILAEFADQGPAIVDIDVLGVAGTSTVVAVLELADGELALAVAPLDDCDPVQVLTF